MAAQPRGEPAEVAAQRPQIDGENGARLFERHRRTPSHVAIDPLLSQGSIGQKRFLRNISPNLCMKARYLIG
jgi:hypothetical protein